MSVKAKIGNLEITSIKVIPNSLPFNKGSCKERREFSLMRNEIKAEDVQKLRENLEENQTDFAKRFGVSQQAVSQWETGHKHLSGPAEKLFKLYIRIFQ